MANSVFDDPSTVSRSGRVRKPKVFYDPSEVVAKRRSAPNAETSKPKKSAKLVEPEFFLSPSPLDISEPTESFEIKKPYDIKVPAKKVPAAEKSRPKAASIGNSRRKTVCVASVYDDGGNGCIVCDRSDVKKGRFVNCIDCIKRGHFTCLRTSKLFKTADQEGNWQCPSCKICEFCNQSNPSEQLYKCIICLNSYHLNCSSQIVPITKSVVKKKFTCGFCLKGASVHSKPIDLPRTVLPNRKSEGFPGFGHFETLSKPHRKSNDNAKIKKAISFTKYQQPTSSKSSPDSSSNDARSASNMDVKVEKKSPTPEQTRFSPSTLSEAFEQQMITEVPNNSKTISVRTDLVQPSCSRQSSVSSEDEIKPENDDDHMEELQYDTKSAITPHESIPDVRNWDVDEVYTYFLAKAPEFADVLRDHQIDGDALLLIRRTDVLSNFNLKLGAALRLHAQIVALQYKNNNPILVWNEF